MKGSIRTSGASLSIRIDSPTKHYLSVEEAMTPSSLVQYFRSFLVKLNMIETQIGQMDLGGTTQTWHAVAS